MALLQNLDLRNSLVVVFVYIPILYCIGWLTYARTLHPLAKVPGPIWPAISRTWLMYRMYQGDLEMHMRAMHKRFKRPVHDRRLRADMLQSVFPSLRVEGCFAKRRWYRNNVNFWAPETTC